MSDTYTCKLRLVAASVTQVCMTLVNSGNNFKDIGLRKNLNNSTNWMSSAVSFRCFFFIETEMGRYNIFAIEPSV